MKISLTLACIIALTLPLTAQTPPRNLHYHVTKNKLTSNQAKLLAKAYALTNNVRTWFDSNLPKAQSDPRNAHCQQLKKAGNKSCSNKGGKGYMDCSCQAVWEKIQDKDGHTQCVAGERTGCENACCVSMCNCIHMPPSDCTIAECKQLKSIINDLVKQKVLIATTT